MKSFSRVTGVAIPFLENDVNTDQIAPVGGGARLSENYAETLFKSRRFLQDGTKDPQFVFNFPQYRAPAILVVGQNFGCGSSRESAVWAIQAVGISCVIAESFADIYRENCLQNGVLPIVLPAAEGQWLRDSVVAVDGSAPFTVDLVSCTIDGPNDLHLSFEISPSDRTRLLEGLDDIGLTLKHVDEIVGWEKRMASAMPWAQRSDADAL